MGSSCGQYWTMWCWRNITVTTIGASTKSKTSIMAYFTPRFASIQGSLVPLTPQESLVLYRPRVARQAQLPFPAQQLWLFELVQTA